MRGFRAGFVVFILCVALAPPAGAVQTIQPGAAMWSSVGGCTLNFVYGGTNGKTYIGTAAHCVDHVDEPIKDDDGHIFGTVRAVGNAGSNAQDWTLIQIDPGVPWSARVKGSAQYPTRVVSESETASGDLLQMSGYGMGYDLTSPTRERRVGSLTSDSSSQYQAVAPAIYGDSGGPIVHIATGGALGIVSRLCTSSPCTLTGPTVQRVISAGGPALNTTLTLKT